MISKAVGELRQNLTRHWLWGLPLAFAIVILDQASKAMVLADQRFNAAGCLEAPTLCGGFRVLDPWLNAYPTLALNMTWNRGVSFGAFQAEGLARWGLFLVTAIVAAGFALWLLQAGRKLTALALSLVIGGAVGNMIDRVRFGAVVDFIDFSGLYFPWVFNVADAAISVGAGVLLLDQVLAGRRRVQ